MEVEVYAAWKLCRGSDGLKLPGRRSVRLIPVPHTSVGVLPPHSVLGLSHLPLQLSWGPPTLWVVSIFFCHVKYTFSPFFSILTVFSVFLSSVSYWALSGDHLLHEQRCSVSTKSSPTLLQQPPPVPYYSVFDESTMLTENFN